MCQENKTETDPSYSFLTRDAMHKRGRYRCRRAVSVCLSVRLSRSCFVSKRINVSSNVFHNWVAKPNVIAIIRRGPPNEGVECRWGRQKSRFSANIWLHRVLSTLRPSGVINTAPPDRGKLITLIANSSKRRRLLIAGDDDEVFMTRSL